MAGVYLKVVRLLHSRSESRHSRKKTGCGIDLMCGTAQISDAYEPGYSVLTNRPQMQVTYMPNVHSKTRVGENDSEWRRCFPLHIGVNICEKNG
jgi:hypothetical protein